MAVCQGAAVVARTRIRGGRARALAGFAALGLYWGAWGALLPALQRDSGVSDGELGTALLLVGLGALVAMRATGWLFDRFGRAVTPASIGILALAGVLPALASSPFGLYAAALALGAASGAMDVAINADAVHEEAQAERPLLNLAHASFSAAVVAASLGAGVLRAAGAGPDYVLSLAGAVLLALAFALRTAPSRAPATTARRRRGSLLRLPSGLLLLGVLAAIGYWVENAWQSWSSVHLERTLHAAAGAGALGPAAFAAAATVGRLTGQRLAYLISPRSLVVAGASLAAGGSALAAVAPNVSLAVAGILLAGLGTSVCAPTMISLAGAAAAPHERGAAVSTVTTFAYLGFLVGPAAVGAVSEAATLRISLGTVAGLALVLALLFALIPLPRPYSSQ
jgi:MFS family permease